MAKTDSPKIVIVGRPNVGKSSLFNRIIGSRKAIVESASGTTRDRLHADLSRKGRTFTIVDTGGFEPARPGQMAALVLAQLQRAIDEADALFLVTDSTAGVTPLDMEFAQRLRKTSKAIYLVANKVDAARGAGRIAEFFELGLGEPYAVSAASGSGVDRLLDDAARRLARFAEGPGPAPAARPPEIRVAIVGRPNVGKSSFLNAVFREERVIVHDEPGTTRDAIDTDFEYKGRRYVLVDTAGMRHNPKLREAADFFGSVRSREAVTRADAAIVMIDGFDGLREDDKRIIEYVIGRGKALVVAVNKWDLSEGVETARYRELLVAGLDPVRNYPVIFMSCKTKKNVLASLDAVYAACERSRAAVPAAELKKLLAGLAASGEIRTRRIKLAYLAQDGVTPPAFRIGVSGTRAPDNNIKRFIENFLRRSRDFEGVPLRITFALKKAPGRR
jgi:GTP-binding protein